MTNRFISFAWWSALVALLCLWQPCYAQFGSNVQGTVTDSTGAVVPHVAITLHNAGTGVDLRETTNETGYYRFTAVAPGNYTVIATQAGFKTESITVTLAPNETRGVDIALTAAGAGTVNVTVSGAAPDLNTDETRIQTTLPSEEITQLPMAGHDVQQILALTPGVTGYESTNPRPGIWCNAFCRELGPALPVQRPGNQRQFVSDR